MRIKLLRRAKPKSDIARKPSRKPPFLAEIITPNRPILSEYQCVLGSSRPTYSSGSRCCKRQSPISRQGVSGDNLGIFRTFGADRCFRAPAISVFVFRRLPTGGASRVHIRVIDFQRFGSVDATFDGTGTTGMIACISALRRIIGADNSAFPFKAHDLHNVSTRELQSDASPHIAVLGENDDTETLERQGHGLNVLFRRQLGAAARLEQFYCLQRDSRCPREILLSDPASARPATTTRPVILISDTMNEFPVCWTENRPNRSAGTSREHPSVFPWKVAGEYRPDRENCHSRFSVPVSRRSHHHAASLSVENVVKAGTAGLPAPPHHI